MSNVVALDKNMLAIENALVRNDLSGLTPQERLTFYNKICESVGLNPLTKPFSFLKLQGKDVLYATKDATEQLRKIHGVSTQIISKGMAGDLFEVHVRARDRSGKEDEELAYVVVKGLSGADLANAMLKCVTKAKRRVTLSICGLGMLDQSELDTIDDSVKGFANNPQIENPFQKDAMPMPEESEFQGEVETQDGPDLTLGDFVCVVGKKYVGQKLSDFDAFQLDGFVKWMHKNAADKNQPMTGDWLEFAQKAEAYLCSIETPVSP